MLQAEVQLLIALATLVSAFAAAIPGIIAIVQNKANKERIDRQGTAITVMSNGGGDSKIQSVIDRNIANGKIVSPGVVPAPTLPVAPTIPPTHSL